jgi:hypothetical protein
MTPRDCARWVATLAVMCAPSMARAQIPHGDSPAESAIIAPPADLHGIPPQYDLSGPRIGATFGPWGEARSQFGWHFEHQIESAARGPWLVVETVLLVAGVEQHQFIPSGTLVFGIRLPEGYEFGVGPSVSLPSMGGFGSAIVAVAGKTFRIKGIQIPLNLAYAFDKDGHRLSVVTGWAVRHVPDYD